MLDPKVAARWTSRVIPLIIAGILGYVSFVIVKPLAVGYLLDPPQIQDTRLRPRRAAAIGILVGYFIVLLFVIATYLRVLHTIATDPGFVPRSAQYREAQRRKAQGGPEKKTSRKWRRDNNEKTEEVVGGMPVTGAPYSETIESHRPDPNGEQPGLAEFYKKDVFVCEGDGRPPWCTVCLSWKPDRAHHCREVGRCVRNMDHFCPWVGGIVSETNFKFFFQFVSWAGALCAYVVILLAYFLAERRKLYITNRDQFQLLDIHWAVALGLAAFFTLFTSGMVFTTLQNILRNLTSVEVLSRNVKIWSLAVYLPHPPDSDEPRNFQTITFPLSSPKPGSTAPVSRTFAILYSKAGDNPFDLGPWNNFRSVMGYTIWDWILPIHRSPNCDHSSMESDWPLGPTFYRMKEEAGLTKIRHSGSTGSNS